MNINEMKSFVQNDLKHMKAQSKVIKVVLLYIVLT